MKRLLVIMVVVVFVSVMLLSLAGTVALAVTSVGCPGSTGYTSATGGYHRPSSIYTSVPGGSSCPSGQGTTPGDNGVPPVPEMYTYILLGTGVLAIAGYAVVMRIRRRAA